MREEGFALLRHLGAKGQGRMVNMGCGRPIARLPASWCGRSGATLNHGAQPHTPLLGYRMGSAGRRVCASPAFRRGRSRADGKHGGKAPYPLYWTMGSAKISFVRWIGFARAYAAGRSAAPPSKSKEQAPFDHGACSFFVCEDAFSAHSTLGAAQILRVPRSSHSAGAFPSF